MAGGVWALIPRIQGTLGSLPTVPWECSPVRRAGPDALGSDGGLVRGSALRTIDMLAMSARTGGMKTSMPCSALAWPRDWAERSGRWSGWGRCRASAVAAPGSNIPARAD